MKKLEEMIGSCIRIWGDFCQKLGGERNALILLGVLAVSFFVLILVLVCRSRSHNAVVRKLGKEGENKVKQVLQSTKSRKKKILNDVVLDCGRGHTTQVDHIMINEYGVFVVETKNYKGVIYGMEESPSWTQSLNGRAFNFYNPVKQNQGHIRHMKELFGDRYPYYSAVTFVGEATLKVDSKIVFDLDGLATYLNSFRKKVLRPKQITDLYKEIKATQKHKRRMNRKHLRNMKRFKKRC